MNGLLLKLSFSSFLVFSSSASIALDDAPQRTSTTSQPSLKNWTGAYLGVHFGYGWGSGRFRAVPGDLWLLDRDLDSVSKVGSDRANFKRALTGVQLGYSHQFGKLVLGAEIDWSGTKTKASFLNAMIVTPSSASVGSGGFSQIDWRSFTRLRVGYAYDDFLFYVVGGRAISYNKFAQGIAYDSYSGYNPYNPLSINNGRERKIIFGTTIGAGVEYALDKNWRARLEYSYANLGTNTATSNSPSFYFFPLGYTVSHRVSNALSLLRFGLNYKLDASHGAVLD